jgi:MinD-like ATPase involved in chromosome partitioning or flagellar assembly
MATIDVKRLEAFYKDKVYVDKDQVILQLLEQKQALREQLEIVENNLRHGISKSIQKFQARCIREVLDENV